MLIAVCVIKHLVSSVTMYFTVQAMSKEFREEEARQVDFNCMTQLRYPGE